MARKKYVICGVSTRANGMFIRPMLDTFQQHCEIVGLLDADPGRFTNCFKKFPALAGTPVYAPDQFQQMIEETKPDAVIVAGVDYTHADYIVQGLEHHLDVISEKPMVTTGADCKRVLDTQNNSRGKLYVTFNYRYSPIHMRIKELILEGRIGRVTSIDLNWYLDTYHGASYFKRWNRKRSNSGGLSVHKSTHHFDLIQWWAGQRPVEAFAYGALNYFGPEGELNPVKEDGRYCGTCRVKHNCKYFMRWSSRSKEIAPPDDHLTTMDSKTGSSTGYRPDGCIFDSEIDIEDTYTAVVKYDKGAMLSYSVNFSLPYEGYRLAINGTKGRIETMEVMSGRAAFHVPEQTIDYFPLFGAKETIHVVPRAGGHGGGDPLILEDLFLGPDPLRPYEIMAGAEAGALAVLTGEAVWKSAQANRPVRLTDLLVESNVSELSKGRVSNRV
ncbi:Gfo/Idh/MocA family protein [Paenibacillus hexagrammi]|uniref:Gfo/Idh/MocA family oxidoreductase n=1 Tax=Paenibacillus hexagrammi TaxID=2908839 RepID=A0ABY3SQA7_9BACL|nr:Gfo/Idh/MocA family oxidoreductase [Paenibacillus sp. YPD9-1]UJF35580.1 Gfo/Idh/MocA family oxidoreductase [Paenibacillus sp. YPD9-1]